MEIIIRNYCYLLHIFARPVPIELNPPPEGKTTKPQPLKAGANRSQIPYNSYRRCGKSESKQKKKKRWLGYLLLINLQGTADVFFSVGVSMTCFYGRN